MNWRTRKLGEIIDIHDSKRVPLSSKERANRQGKYPYYGASGIIDYIDDYIFDGRYLLIAEDGENLNSRKLPIAFFANGKFWVNNHAHIVRGKSNAVDDNFLKAWFAQADISGYITGTAQPKLSQKNLKEIRLELPPLPTQRRIAAILSAYDDLIENNTRRIKALEQAAHDLYREWFVHFRFPGHESVAMVDSGTDYGMIPQGWGVVKLKQMTSVITRGYQPKYDKESDCRVINQRCIRDFKIDLSLTRGNDEEKRPIRKEERFLEFGDVLVNSTGTGTLGRVAQVYMNLAKHTVDSHVTIVRPSGVNIEFFGLLMEHLQYVIEQMGRGATNQTELSRTELGDLLVIRPSSHIQTEFSNMVAPIREHVIKLMHRNDILREARDLLLPRLVSGQLSVDDVELPEDE